MENEMIVRKHFWEKIIFQYWRIPSSKISRSARVIDNKKFVEKLIKVDPMLLFHMWLCLYKGTFSWELKFFRRAKKIKVRSKLSIFEVTFDRLEMSDDENS